MKPQSFDTAISTADLLSCLESNADDPKHTFRDLLGSLAQVAAALSICLAIHGIA